MVCSSSKFQLLRKLMQEDHLSLEFEIRQGNIVRALLEEGRKERGKKTVCLSKMYAALFCTQGFGQLLRSALHFTLNIYETILSWEECWCLPDFYFWELLILSFIGN